MRKNADEYAAFAADGGRPRLLLHVCCAPCMSAGIERLAERFDVTAYFYNPNITQRREYYKRLAAVHKLIDSLSLGIPVIGVGFCPAEYDAAVGDAKGGKERGEKCRRCIAARLKKTAEECARLGIKYCATTLTASPLKDAAFINETGARLAEEAGVTWVPTDFKKRGGCVRIKELCGRFGIYRQHYCGCTPDKLVVAVTGGIASGKSSFTRMLGRLGAYTVDADEVTRELQQPGTETTRRIIEAFPKCADGGALNRKALAAEVFADGSKLRALEAIVHPAVKAELKRRIAESGAKIIVAEVPLLFESGAEDMADVVVTVTAPESERRERARLRSGMDEEAFRRVCAAQLTDERRNALSDVLVVNDGDETSLGNRARELYAEWTEIVSGTKRYG